VWEKSRGKRGGGECIATTKLRVGDSRKMPGMLEPHRIILVAGVTQLALCIAADGKEFNLKIVATC
jgi:hypothetical protein